MNGRPWTESELKTLRAEYSDTPAKTIAEKLGRSLQAVYGQAKKFGLEKSPEFLSSPDAGRIQPGERRGTSGEFAKGHQPWNTGLKGWTAGGQAEQTRFRSGNRPHNWKPIGSERITHDGYVQRKMTDTGYPPRDWRGVHILMWEEHNGPVPQGHVVVFRNGDNRDFRLENLELITKAENMRRNTIHKLPKELADVCRIKGLVKRQINKRINHGK
jgi:hypothetical protein